LLDDTQIMIWYVTDPARLSAAATAAVETSVADLEPVGVSAFSLVELVYAVEKRTNTVSLAQADAIRRVLDDPESPFEVLRVDLAVARRERFDPRTVRAPGRRGSILRPDREQMTSAFGRCSNRSAA
jgi:PIN domain nuclease of toxin-antitoxin system